MAYIIEDYDDGEVIGILPFDTVVEHIGTPDQSGRYRRGSGKDAYQHEGGFRGSYEKLRKEFPNATKKELAEKMGMSVREFNARMSLQSNDQKLAEYKKIKYMVDNEQRSFNAIANELGMSPSTVRSLYNNVNMPKLMQARASADALKERIKETNGGFIDIGEGVERELGISTERMAKTVSILKDEGYEVYKRRVEQATNKGSYTTLTLLCPPGTKHEEIYDDMGKIKSYKPYEDIGSSDGGDTFHKLAYPTSLDSKRLIIRSKEEGGADRDGIIDIRPGCKDLDLGGSSYAQVRILVDNKKYLKGIAMYADDLPDGVDVRFNSNKSKEKPKLEHLKDIKTEDPNNPFGSLILPKGQSYYEDSKTGEKKLSLINKTRDEGEWAEWSKSLPSQFLAKQSIQLINSQLNLNIDLKKAEYDQIMKLENPVVKKRALLAFADDCDTTAVHLDAAALPRQKYQVLLPLTTCKEGEIYAPNYKQGETVALIRYPHGGVFEVATCVVNNNNKEGRKLFGDAKDAVGVNSATAAKLSGADFDGDTAMVIPCNRTASGQISKVQINYTDSLKGLKGFDPKSEYPEREGMTRLSKKRQQIEMGMVTNLITDMTLAGANPDELSKAVRHSMVIIDAEKHKLDYKLSEKDNDIKSLKAKYQGRIDPETGNYTEKAATIISRAKSQIDAPKRIGSGHIDPETGKVVYTIDETSWTTVSKTGKVTEKHPTRKSTQMAETDDAFTLVRDKSNPKEVVYAEYANNLKAMANEARKETTKIKGSIYKKEAEALYQEEVRSLQAKIDESARNAPRERMAQVIAASKVQSIERDNGTMSKEQRGKTAQRELANARNAVGSKRPKFDITPKEWEAIQAGAIGSSVLEKVINYAGIDKVRSLATPKSANRTITDAQIAQIAAYKSKMSDGKRTYTNEDIAEALGISVSTVNKY